MQEITILDYIMLAKALNIYNIIHDTEGIHYDKDTYFKINNNYLKYIDRSLVLGGRSIKLFEI